jgi:hypothetical protein
MRTAPAKPDQPLLQNVWQEIEYRLVVCRAANGTHNEFARGIKKNLQVALRSDLRLIFMWLLLPCQQIYVLAPLICNHPANKMQHKKAPEKKRTKTERHFSKWRTRNFKRLFCTCINKHSKAYCWETEHETELKLRYFRQNLCNGISKCLASG